MASIGSGLHANFCVHLSFGARADAPAGPCIRNFGAISPEENTGLCPGGYLLNSDGLCSPPGCAPCQALLNQESRELGVLAETAACVPGQCRVSDANLTAPSSEVEPARRLTPLCLQRAQHTAHTCTVPSASSQLQR